MANFAPPSIIRSVKKLVCLMCQTTYCPNLFWDGQFMLLDWTKAPSFLKVFCVSSLFLWPFWHFFPFSSTIKSLCSELSVHYRIFPACCGLHHPAQSLWISAVKHTPKDSHIILDRRLFSGMASNFSLSPRKLMDLFLKAVQAMWKSLTSPSNNPLNLIPGSTVPSCITCVDTSWFNT